MAPEIEQVMTTGSSRLIPRSWGRGWPSSDGDDRAALVGTLDALAGGHLERPAHRGPRLARVDDVVDHVVAGRDVDVDDAAVGGDQLGPLGRRVLGLLDLLAEDDLHRALGPH